jgi:hypothetical protein
MPLPAEVLAVLAVFRPAFTTPTWHKGLCQKSAHIVSLPLLQILQADFIHCLSVGLCHDQQPLKGSKTLPE